MHLLVSRRIFEMLVNHLIQVEEEKAYVVERYYPDWTKERNDFQELLNTYIRNIEDIVYNKLKVDEGTPDDCPYAIIGCRIVLRDAYNNELEKLHIVSPFKGNIDFDVDSASYLSPMGKAFLLKKVHDEVLVETPMGIFQYTVEAIELPADIFQYY